MILFFFYLLNSSKFKRLSTRVKTEKAEITCLRWKYERRIVLGKSLENVLTTYPLALSSPHFYSSKLDSKQSWWKSKRAKFSHSTSVLCYVESVQLFFPVCNLHTELRRVRRLFQCKISLEQWLFCGSRYSLKDRE